MLPWQFLPENKLTRNNYIMKLLSFWRILAILLSFNSVSTSFTNEFYDKWVQKYRQISGNKNPPKRYKEWIRIVSKMDVSVEPSVYKKVFEHVGYFKNKNLTVPRVKMLLSKVQALNPTRHDIIGINLKEMVTRTIKLMRWPLLDNFELLSSVLDPSIDCFGIIQAYDEGMVIPADDNQNKSYADMRDVMKRSASMRNESGEYAQSCIHLQAPCSFHVVPFDVPIFGSNRLKGAKDLVFANDQTSIGRYEIHLLSAFNAPHWEYKTSAAVFRGTGTGINYTKVITDNISITNNPRYKLHQMTMLQNQGKLNCSVKLDFGLTEYQFRTNNRTFKKWVMEQFPLVKTLHYKEQFRFKYLVIVDGHAWPDRLAFYLSSGSLVFLATLHEEFVINQIIPNEHYIKIKPNLSDLIEKIEWAVKNDAEAKRIAENGKQFALNNLRKPNVKAYNAMLFMEYQALFDETGNM